MQSVNFQAMLEQAWIGMFFVILAAVAFLIYLNYTEKHHKPAHKK